MSDNKKNYKWNNIMYKIFLFILLTSNFLFSQNSLLDSLQTIRAFQFADSNNASSGYVNVDQFKFLKDYGFTHVISLLPGDQHQEDSIVTSLGMTFTQIEVNWKKPTIENVQNYFNDMKKYSGKKVLLHCVANMRASAFMYLYRTTQLGIKKDEAKKLMNDIWDPKENEQWDNLIKTILKKEGLENIY